MTGTLLDEHGTYEMQQLSMVKGGKGKPFKVHLDPHRHIVLDQNIPPRGWYKPKHEEGRRRPRPCYTEAILTTPYGGHCPIKCSYCYVNNGTRGYRATGLPTVDPEYPEKMSKRIAKMMISGAWYISSFTEPFHPYLEEQYHITQRLSQVLVDNGLPLFYLSKRTPPNWARDFLLANPYSYMQFSINTSNNDHWRRMAPGAPDLDKMLRSIDHLETLGVYVSIQCNPIIAGVTSLEDLLSLCDMLADAGAKHIIFKFVEQVFNNRQVIVDRLYERKLPHVDTFDKLFSQVIGGVYTIQEDVRIAWLDELLKKTRECDMTMSLCYEYYDDGGAGDNLAPYYTTGDQCHGRGIPLYYRFEPGSPWEPLSGCYRKGCLYCEEHGTRICDTPEMWEARALTYKDLHSIRLKTMDDDWWNLADSCYPPEDAELYVAGGPDRNGIWHATIGNPGFQTDAELWGWRLEEEQ